MCDGDQEHFHNQDDRYGKQVSISDHERIFLQTIEESDHQYEGRTWCQDQIDETDTEYVRADLFATLETERIDLLNAITEAIECFDRQEADELIEGLKKAEREAS